MSRASAEQLCSHAPWWVLAGAILATQAMAFAAVFGMPENMSSPRFGTAWAPYSDALGPWLDGGLAFLFGLPPPTYLYRPTVGLFWASIIGTTGRLEMIPMFFVAWLLGIFAAAIMLAGDPRVQKALIVALGLCALIFPDAWHSLFISSTAIDLPSLALTTSGVLLLLWGRGPTACSALLMGCACLGIAAALRGPMMLAGIVVIGVRVLLIERTPAKVIAAAAVLFLVPIAFDAALQRHFAVVNNGVTAMFCFYTDPSHTWSPACHVVYLARRPTNAQVLQEYLQFLLSAAGLSFVFDSMKWRISRDVAPLLALAPLMLLVGAGLLASWTEKNLMRAPLSSPFVRALAVAALLTGLRAFPATWNTFALCGFFLAAAAILRQWGTVMCLSGYLAGTLYLCLLGLQVHDRLQHSFSVCLYLGIGLLILESARPGATDSRGWFAAHAAPAAVALAILFLYLGNYVAPSQLSDTYRLQVRGRAGTAIKVGSDSRINRSLYYSGERHLFYTADDTLAIGGVRKYSKLANSMTGSASFVQPNAFVD